MCAKGRVHACVCKALFVYGLTLTSISLSLCHRWSNLKALADERRASLDTALERAKHFHGNWKREADWLTEAERKAYADWMPRGLPETCAAEIVEHEACTHTHPFTHTHTHTHTHLYMYRHTHIHVHVYVCTAHIHT